MAPKFTPGPWEAVLVNDPRGQPVPYYRGLICTVEHGSRYLSVVTADDSGTSSEQWEHNCRLISAAPELLEALKRADQFITNGVEMGFIRLPEEGSDDPALETPEIVRAAIAKAEVSP